MLSLLDGDQRWSHHGRHCHGKAKPCRPRHLHESSVTFGDTAPCYSTTHGQSFSGRSADGRPLLFQLREPSFPSQHRSHLHISDTHTALHGPLLSHNQDVHGPKHISPERLHTRTDLRLDNWARCWSGQAVRELTNPPDPSESCTSHTAGHTLPPGRRSPQQAGGRPTLWHGHDILTGEQRRAEGKPCRRSRDELLWAARRRETDCTALRLY